MQAPETVPKRDQKRTFTEQKPPVWNIDRAAIAASSRPITRPGKLETAWLLTA
jgi:hypothetical protein